MKNNDEVVCNAVASYGQNPAYISHVPMNMSMDGMKMEMTMNTSHISSISTCSNVGIIKAGDRWSVSAYYNTSKYAPMTDSDGSLEPIMGISLVYFVEGTYVNATNGSKILQHEAPAESASTPSSNTKTSSGFRLTSSSIWYIALLVFIAVL